MTILFRHCYHFIISICFQHSCFVFLMSWPLGGVRSQCQSSSLRWFFKNVYSPPCHLTQDYISLPGAQPDKGKYSRGPEEDGKSFDLPLDIFFSPPYICVCCHSLTRILKLRAEFLPASPLISLRSCLTVFSDCFKLYAPLFFFSLASFRLEPFFFY